MSDTDLTARDRYVISHLHSQMSYRVIAQLPEDITSRERYLFAKGHD